MKDSNYIKDVLQYICMAHLIVMIILNSLKDFICVSHTIKVIEKMTSLSILRIWKWISYNQFYDNRINIIKTPDEILKFVI